MMFLQFSYLVQERIYVPVFQIQPGYDDLNPDWRLSTEKRKKIKGELYDVW